MLPGIDKDVFIKMLVSSTGAHPGWLWGQRPPGVTKGVPKIRKRKGKEEREKKNEEKQGEDKKEKRGGFRRGRRPLPRGAPHFFRDWAPYFVWAPQTKRVHQIVRIEFEN